MADIFSTLILVMRSVQETGGRCPYGLYSPSLAARSSSTLKKCTYCRFSISIMVVKSRKIAQLHCSRHRYPETEENCFSGLIFERKKNTVPVHIFKNRMTGTNFSRPDVHCHIIRIVVATVLITIDRQ
jgi:hypothetical protein